MISNLRANLSMGGLEGFSQSSTTAYNSKYIKVNMNCDINMCLGGRGFKSLFVHQVLFSYNIHGSLHI